MTKKEANQILALLNTNYPDTFKDLSDDTYRMKVNLWADVFKNVPYPTVYAAVMAYIANSPERFAPNIGQIKEQIRQLTNPDELTEGEAWALVQKAMRNSGYQAAEEFAALPPTVRQVVGSAANLREWGNADSDTAVSVIASNFMRSYRALQSREAAQAKTPELVKQYFEGITKPMPAAMPAPSQEAPRLEAPPLEGEKMRAAIAAARGAAGDVIITKDAKAAALERLRNYGEG